MIKAAELTFGKGAQSLRSLPRRRDTASLGDGLDRLGACVFNGQGGYCLVQVGWRCYRDPHDAKDLETKVVFSLLLTNVDLAEKQEGLAIRIVALLLLPFLAMAGDATAAAPTDLFCNVTRTIGASTTTTKRKLTIAWDTKSYHLYVDSGTGWKKICDCRLHDVDGGKIILYKSASLLTEIDRSTGEFHGNDLDTGAVMRGTCTTATPGQKKF